MEAETSKIIKNSIIGVVIGLICNGLVTIIFNKINPTQGEIVKNELVKIDSINYQLNLIICNYNDKTVNGIDFQVDNASLDHYDSNLHLSVENKDNRLIRISNIYPNKNYSINLYLKRKATSKAEPNLEPLNVEELKFKYKKLSDFDDEYTVLIWQVIISSLSYGLLFGCFTYVNDNKNKKTKKYIDEKIDEHKNSLKERETSETILKEESKSLGKKINELMDMTDKIGTNHAKTKLLYNRELRDYKKENDFYKDLIKRLVEEQKDEKINFNELHSIITDELKTYTTKGLNSIEFNTIDVIVEIVKDKNSLPQSIEPIHFD